MGEIFNAFAKELAGGSDENRRILKLPYEFAKYAGYIYGAAATLEAMGNAFAAGTAAPAFSMDM